MDSFVNIFLAALVKYMPNIPFNQDGNESRPQNE